MACETNTWLVMFFLFLAANCMQHCVLGVSQVPCLFIYGDSMSDSGNNNELPTTFKSNYRPYGVDFPLGPTGRFINGRTEIDIIGNISIYLSRPLIFLCLIFPLILFTFSDILTVQKELKLCLFIEPWVFYTLLKLTHYWIHICSSVSGIWEFHTTLCKH